jgi:hypothetical protein
MVFSSIRRNPLNGPVGYDGVLWPLCDDTTPYHTRSLTIAALCSISTIPGSATHVFGSLVPENPEILPQMHCLNDNPLQQVAEERAPRDSGDALEQIVPPRSLAAGHLSRDALAKLGHRAAPCRQHE